MDKENTYSLLLLLGLIVGAGMAAISIVEESNLTNYEWAAKIEETTISMENPCRISGEAMAHHHVSAGGTSPGWGTLFSISSHRSRMKFSSGIPAI